MGTAIDGRIQSAGLTSRNVVEFLLVLQSEGSEDGDQRPGRLDEK